MVDEPAVETLDEQAEEEGGPVKSFLEHLEDLRWMLIKSGVAAGVAMLICLLAGNHVVAILELPLKKASIKFPEDVQVMRVLFGTNQLGIFQLRTNDNPAAVFSTNRFVQLQIVPLTIGTNQVLGMNVQPDLEGERGHRLPI